MYVSAGSPRPSHWSYPVARRSPGPMRLQLPAIYVRSSCGQWRGLGAPTLAQGAAAGAASGVTIGYSTATSTGSAIAGGVAGALATTAGILAAIPGGQIPAAFLAAASALVGPIAQEFKGCGVTCQQTTDIANKVATAAGQITAQYWAQPVRTVSMRNGAVAALQELYGYLIQNCNAIGGQGGRQCVADRQPGGKYDFQAQQIGPIMNDTAVVADPVAPNPVTSTLSNLFGGSSASGGLTMADLLLPAGLLAAGLLL